MWKHITFFFSNFCTFFVLCLVLLSKDINRAKFIYMIPFRSSGEFCSMPDNFHICSEWTGGFHIKLPLNCTYKRDVIHFALTSTSDFETSSGYN